MNTRARAVRRLLFDQNGAEITELALVLALIVAGTIGVIAHLGGDIKTLYESIVKVLP